MWKMVLKRPFIDDTVEDCTLHIHCAGLLRNSAHPNYTIVLLKRWSWKSHLSVTVGKPLHIQSGLLADRAYWVDVIGLFRRWSCKGHSSLTQGRLYSCSGLLRDRALGHFPRRQNSLSQSHRVRTWSCKRVFIIDKGKPLHIHSGLPEDRVHIIGT